MRRDLNPTRAPIRCSICSARTTARSGICRTCTPTESSPSWEHALAGGHWVTRAGGVKTWVARPTLTLAPEKEPDMPPHEDPAIRWVLTIVAHRFGVTAVDIQARDRHKHVAAARAVAFWLLHQDGRAYAQIGRDLERDHTTVMHAVKRVENDPRLLGVATALRAEMVGNELADERRSA